MATKILSATAGLAMLLAMSNSMPLVAEDAPAGAKAASATVEEIYIKTSDPALPVATATGQIIACLESDL